MVFVRPCIDINCMPNSLHHSKREFEAIPFPYCFYDHLQTAAGREEIKESGLLLQKKDAEKAEKFADVCKFKVLGYTMVGLSDSFKVHRGKGILCCLFRT